MSVFVTGKHTAIITLPIITIIKQFTKFRWLKVTQIFHGIPRGLLFKGTITRNGKKAVDLYIDMQSGNDDFEELSFDTEKLGIPASEEDDFVEDFKEAFRENVFDEYDWPDGRE